MFLSLGLLIMFLLYRSMSKGHYEQCALDGKTPEECGTLVEKVVNDFATADFFWLFVVVFLFMLSNVSRAIRWNLLIDPLGRKPRFLNSLGAIMVGYFANLGIPRIGEFVRAGVLSRYEKIEVGRVMGTVAIDRAVDLVSIMIMTVLAITLQYQQIWDKLVELLSLDTLTKLFIAAAIAGALGLGLFFLLRKRIEQTKLYAKVVGLIKGVIEGLGSIRKLKKPGLFIFHSISIWVLYYLLNYLCFFSFEPTSHLMPLVGLAVFVFGAWGIVIPTPGGMGSYHYLTVVALSIYGISQPVGFSYTMISFLTITVGGHVLFGLISLLILPFYNQNYNPDPIDGTDQTDSAKDPGLASS